MLMKVGRLGQSNRVLGDIVPAVFTPASLAPLMLLDGDADASSSVWLNAATKWPSAYQAVTASQPVVSAGVVEFDGTDDYVLGGYYTYGANTPQTLPDGAGSDTGKGITCTGLALDDESDSFWIANHGQATAVDPYTPSIMNVSKDGTTEISEIELISTFPSMQSIQGLAVDTSDSTLWFVSSAENLIRHITKAGADLGSISVDADPNGLAYDSSDDSLLVLYNNKQLKRYSASTGSLIETITTFSSLSNLDHLFLDEAMNILWISYGASGNTGRVSAYSIDDDVLSDPVRLPESDAIEGIYIDGTTLYVMNDGYFHNGTLNQLHQYSFDPSDIINEITRSYNALEFNMVFKIGGTSSSTEAIISLGNPLSGFGFGFFLVGNTDDTIRLIVDDGIAPLDTVDIVCSNAFTGFSVITIKADLTNRTISVYQNGVSQGQGTYDGAIKNTLTYDAFSLGALPDGTRSTHIDVKDLCVTDYLLSASQGNAIGNYYADEHGLVWTNM